MNNHDPDNQKITWLQMIMSTLAAIFGVQNKKNKERDFTHGDIKKFIVVAIGFTLTILLLLIGLVQFVLRDVV